MTVVKLHTMNLNYSECRHQWNVFFRRVAIRVQ